MTPAQVLSTCRDQLYEPTPGFWSDAELYTYMWQAEQEIALQIKCTPYTTALTSVTAQSMYTRPSLYNIERLTWDSVKLKKIDMTQLDALQRVAYGGLYIIGRPMHYYELASTIGLWPIPSYSATINIWGTQIPAQVTTASSQFTVGEYFHPMLSNYVMYRAVMKDQDDGRTKFFKQQWDQDLIRAYTFWNSRQNADMYNVVREEDSYRTVELGMI
jgi:hypothetical protein